MNSQLFCILNSPTVSVLLIVKIDTALQKMFSMLHRIYYLEFEE